MVLIKLSHGHVMYTCMNLLILSSPNGEKSGELEYSPNALNVLGQVR